MLRPRGTLLLSTPHHGPGTLLRLALSPRRFAEHFEPRSDHLRFYSPRTLRALLHDLGFDVAQLRLAGGPPLLRSTILARADARLSGARAAVAAPCTVSLRRRAAGAITL